MTGAVITKNGDAYAVENLIVLDGEAAIPAIKEAFGYDFLIPVDNSVQIGDIFDADKQIFLRDGERVYPEITDKERIEALEAAQHDTDAALMELAQMIGGA